MQLKNNRYHQAMFSLIRIQHSKKTYRQPIGWVKQELQQELQRLVFPHNVLDLLIVHPATDALPDR